MVCGAGQGGMGYVLLFCSPDLLHWEYAGKLFESDQFGAVPECPDFFPLGINGCCCSPVWIPVPPNLL